MGHQRSIKSEHNGAKNSGGHRGKREEAKTYSKKVRRANDRKEIKNQGDSASR